MALPPNMTEGQGGGNAKKRYLRSQRKNRQGAERAERRAKPIAKPSAPSPVAAPVAPPTPTYGPSMQRAQADAQLVYGDPILRAQAQGQNAAPWFDTYKQDAARQGALSAARTQAALGQTYAPTQGPAVQTALGDQAAQSRGIQNQNFTNLLTAQGNAQQDYFGGRELVGSAAQLQTRLQAQAAGVQLEKDRAQYVVQQRGTYRDQAHQRLLEDKAFGLDVAEKQADVVTDRKRIRLDRKKSNQATKLSRQKLKQDAKLTPSEQKTKEELEYFRKHGYKPPTGPPKATAPAGKKGLTPTQQRAARKQRQKAATDVNTVTADMNNLTRQKVEILDKEGEGTGRFRAPTREEVFARLRKEGASQDQITVAFAIRHNVETWDAKTRAAARRLGMRVPASKKPHPNASPNLGDQRGENAKGAAYQG